MEDNIKINLEGNSGELIIREGKALPLHEPVKVVLSGNIDSPANFLEARSNVTDVLEAHAIINRDDMTIILQVDEKQHYGSKVQGKLVPHPAYEKFGINSGRYETSSKLADLFKMNRSFFENQTTAMSLVTDLRNFSAKVNKEIEKHADDRGNKRDLKAQVVTSNLPEKFNLKLPLFKGFDAELIEVEVYINPEDLTCALISPAANDRITEVVDSIFDEQKYRMLESLPGILFIEQ